MHRDFKQSVAVDGWLPNVCLRLTCNIFIFLPVSCIAQEWPQGGGRASPMKVYLSVSIVLLELSGGQRVLWTPMRHFDKLGLLTFNIQLLDRRLCPRCAEESSSWTTAVGTCSNKKNNNKKKNCNPSETEGKCYTVNCSGYMHVALCL